MVKALEINSSFTPRRGPVVLAILDGVGFGKYADGNLSLHQTQGSRYCRRYAL